MDKLSKLTVLVWNMDYWKSSKREAGWDYIQSKNPDIALLNECSNHDSQKYSIHHIDKNNWGCGVFSNHELTEKKFEMSHPEAIACGELEIDEKKITAISLYGKLINTYSITPLHRSLSDLTPLFVKKSVRDWLLIGGDFNADEQYDDRYGGRSHHIFFERLRDFKLYDCYKKFHTGPVQTIRHSSSSFPYQNDYLFTGKKLYDACVSCEVIDDENLYTISDHNPIIAEFDLR